MIYLGLDPGKSGGVAYIGNGILVTHQLEGMTLRQMLEVLQDISDLGQDAFGNVTNIRCVLEQVTGYVSGDKGRAGMGPSMFAFGKRVGHLEAMLCAAEIPYRTVVARSWQKALGVAPRKVGMSDSQWKASLRQHAERLFPQDKFNTSVADAVLLAEFARRYVT